MTASAPSFTHVFRLHTSPPPRIPRAAGARTLPLQHEDEFAAIAALPAVDVAIPILVTMTQMQEIMADTVNLAFASLAPLDICLLTARMPAGPRIPERLLAPDVFLVGDLECERRRCLARGMAVLTIDNRIVRHPLDGGDNTMTLTWHGADNGWGPWSRLLDGVIRLGFASNAA